MTTPPAKLTVLAGKQFACVKVTGRGNFTLSVDFKTLITTLGQQGCTYFVIDLSECLLLDSTFLGVLAGFGLKANQAGSKSGGQAIELLNPNARTLELLENVGVLQLFKISQGPLSVPEAVAAQPLEPARPSREEVKRACLEAHQTLMDINPANVAKFRDVAQFLADNLQKPAGQP